MSGQWDVGDTASTPYEHLGGANEVSFPANASNGGSRGCYNCGEEGHMKSECPNPPVERKFTGICRLCQVEGHRAANCPDAPVQVCRNCEETGHSHFECKNPRKLNHHDVETMDSAKAWKEIIKAAEAQDMDDVMDAIKKLMKATPDLNYSSLENDFRKQDIGLYVIAMEKDLIPTYTNMDMQGNMDKKYSVTIRFSPQPKRPSENAMWPSSAEDNIQRLMDCGEPVERGLPKCSNCDEIGHYSKWCKKTAKEEIDKPSVHCFNCDEDGHRVRDCPKPREGKNVCRNCKISGHNARDCKEPRSATGLECNKCGKTGHFARDCPTGGGSFGSGCRNCGQDGHIARECNEPRNMAKVQCRNCDAFGHISKDCDKRRDYSRVKCTNCGQMGHTKVRCKSALVDENENPKRAAEVDEWDTGAFSNDSTAAAADTYGSSDVTGGYSW